MNAYIGFDYCLSLISLCKVVKMSLTTRAQSQITFQIAYTPFFKSFFKNPDLIFINHFLTLSLPPHISMVRATTHSTWPVRTISSGAGIKMNMNQWNGPTRPNRSTPCRHTSPVRSPMPISSDGGLCLLITNWQFRTAFFTPNISHQYHRQHKSCTHWVFYHRPVGLVTGSFLQVSI